MTTAPTENLPPRSGTLALLVLAWMWVGVPLAWGVWQTIDKALALFR